MNTLVETLKQEREDKEPKGFCVESPERMVDTACLGCVFAEGELNKVKVNGDDALQFKQSGCRLNLLQTFRDRGCNVEEAYDASTSEFYVIHDRVCPFFRNTVWLQNEDMVKAEARVRSETVLGLDAVIYIGEGMNPEDLVETINSLKNGVIQPKRFYVANNNCCTPGQLMKIMRSVSAPWRVENITEEASVGRALDLVIKKCQSMFVMCLISGTTVNPDLLSQISSALYDDLDKFLILKPEKDTIDGLTILRTIHGRVGGNFTKPIYEKTENIAKEQECQYLVRPLTEVVTQPFVSSSPVIITEDMLVAPLPA